MTVIIRDIEQGSRAWHELRLGIPTASEFSRIITPTGKLSASREEYMAELLAEWALGEVEPEPPWMSEWMERGKLLEPEARSYYEFHRDQTVDQVSFIYKDKDRMAGCSPDGLVGEDGLLELKCAKAKTHLMWLAQGKVPRQHAIQLQGQLWGTGRKFVDFLSFYPQLPPFIVRAEPDPKIQEALDEHIPTFVEKLLAGRRALVDAGVNPPDMAEIAPQGEKNGPYGDPSADLPDNVTILSAG